ncbi:MAG: glycine zipper 2TM domain-containing protein [Wenzhouxiangella sp.]|nr:glycine zipper 2TM domain-containing protein [Wenzhouxiangella sp.]
MITRTLALSLLLLAASLAQASGTHFQTVPVVDVEPIYSVSRTPVDRTVCWEETYYERTHRSRSSTTPTLVGAIIGGVIGNQFGGGSGKKAATVAGAALGGSIGRDAARDNRRDRYQPVTEERCSIQREFEERNVISGYRVSYLYQGDVHQTTLRDHPGDQMRVRISVTPVP